MLPSFSRFRSFALSRFHSVLAATGPVPSSRFTVSQTSFRRGQVGNLSYNDDMNVCLFDIDGTLLASGGAGKAALELAFTEEFGVALEHHVPYSGRTDRAIMRDLFRLHKLPDT